jgi:hypothetical protein
MKSKRKASISEETFDEFLASQGILEACEDRAIRRSSRSSWRQPCRSKD